MCGRYGLKLNIEEVVAAVAALPVASSPDEATLAAWQPHGEIAPTDAAPMLVRRGSGEQLTLTLGRWGITRPPDSPDRRPELVINARAETLQQRPLFRPGQRALLPASGWYEWPAPPTPAKRGARRTPMWLHRAADDPDTRESLLWLAALAFNDPADTQAPTRFVIVTRPPEASIASIHDRMPAIVPAGAAADWMHHQLSPADLQRLHHPDLRFVESPPRATRQPDPLQYDLFGPHKT